MSDILGHCTGCRRWGIVFNKKTSGTKDYWILPPETAPFDFTTISSFPEKSFVHKIALNVANNSIEGVTDKTLWAAELSLLLKFSFNTSSSK